MVTGTYVSKCISNPQAHFSPPFDTASFPFSAEPPVQQIFIDGVNFTGMLVLEASTISRIGGIGVIDKDIVCDDQDQSDGGCTSISNSDLGSVRFWMRSSKLIHHVHRCQKYPGPTLASLEGLLRRAQ